MVSRRKDVDLRRRPPKRSPRHRILCVCEGEVTEPAYLKEFQHEVRNQLVHVEPVGPAGVPLTVVQKAIEMRNVAERRAKDERDENLKWDEVWAVHDCDDHPNISQAHALANEEHIWLAFSNPSFELWALLHFEDLHAETHRRGVRAALKIHLPRYEKELDFQKIHQGYEEAKKRAEALDAEAKLLRQPGRNPTTSVFRLTERIRTKN